MLFLLFQLWYLQFPLLVRFSQKTYHTTRVIPPPPGTILSDKSTSHAAQTKHSTKTHNNQPKLFLSCPLQLYTLSILCPPLLIIFSSLSILFNGIPDDPCFSNVPCPTKEDIANLANNKLITSSLIEWVIHHTWFL